MSRTIVGFGIGLAVVCLAACGSSGGSASGADGPHGTPGAVLKVGAQPSVSSTMICGEAQPAIAGALAVDATRVTEPTWIDDVYSCTYEYRDGSFTLSVKEVNGIPNAEKYLDDLETLLGVDANAPTPALGQQSFSAKGGDLVVQKDNKVLTVDVSRLPPEFGPDRQAPADVARSVGAVIMGCWTGA